MVSAAAEIEHQLGLGCIQALIPPLQFRFDFVERFQLDPSLRSPWTARPLESQTPIVVHSRFSAGCIKLAHPDNWYRVVRNT